MENTIRDGDVKGITLTQLSGYSNVIFQEHKTPEINDEGLQHQTDHERREKSNRSERDKNHFKSTSEERNKNFKSTSEERNQTYWSETKKSPVWQNPPGIYYIPARWDSELYVQISRNNNTTEQMVCD